jgi:hypothetical protein
MKGKTYKSRKDPFRRVVEREAKRKGRGDEQSRAGNSSDLRRRNRKALDEAAPQTGTRGGP